MMKLQEDLLNLTLKRTAIALACLLTFANSSEAARKRPVRAAVTTLTVTATDAATSRPIRNVQVTLNDALVSKTDQSGIATFSNLKTGNAQIVIERVGYDTVQRTIDIKGGANTLTVPMNPRPSATLTSVDGSTKTVDVTTLEFGFSVTFAGYTKAPYIETCEGGVDRRVLKSDIRSINGPARVVSAGTCCTFPQAQQIAITLKNGQTINAILKDSCPGYKLDVITNDRETGDAIFLPFEQLRTLTLP